MSVIPFITKISSRTIVETREDFENAGGLNGNVIFIQNLDSEQINKTSSSNVSYDLTVGDEYRDHRDFGTHDLLDGEKIRLQPGAAVIIETAELVQFPKSRFGHIVPKVSLLQDGLSNTSSKIDPGYEGKLLITVFNLGKREVALEKGQPFCTLYILDVAFKEEVTPYQKGPQRIAGNVRKNFFSMFLDFIELKQVYFTIALTIATLALTAVQILQTLEQQRLPPSLEDNRVLDD
jgi:dCTP deaminase